MESFCSDRDLSAFTYLYNFLEKRFREEVTIDGPDMEDIFSSYVGPYSHFRIFMRQNFPRDSRSRVSSMLIDMSMGWLGQMEEAINRYNN